MDTLPNELIEIILSMVPTDDLVTKFRAVNKSYFAISQRIVSEIGPSFKRDHTYNDHQIMVLARDYPSITSLNVSKWDLSTAALRVIFTQFPHLKTLKLNPIYLMPGNELRKHVIPSVTSLSIKVASTRYSRFNSGTFEVASINTIFPNLEHLEILDEPTQANVDDLLKDVKTIKSMTVEGPNIEKIAKVPLLKTLTIANNHQNSIQIVDCPMLETLNIKYSQLAQFDFLKKIPNVQHLTLQRGFVDLWNRYEHQVVGLINNLIQYCRNIRSLWIEQYQLTSKDLERLVNELPNLKKIVITPSKYDENLPTTAIILQEKHKNVKITVPARNFTTGIDIDEYNKLIKVEKTRDPYVECQYCHLQYQCAPEIHEEVCYKWPAWDCLFVHDGCGKTGMTKDEFRAHIDKCDYNLIKCPFEECAETIRRYERHEHWKQHEKTFAFRLKETHMICPNVQYGCLDMFDTPAACLNHVSKCQHSHPLCMSCKKEFASIDECAKHMSECTVTQKRRVMPEESIATILEKAAKFTKANEARDQNHFHLRGYSPVYLGSSYDGYY